MFVNDIAYPPVTPDPGPRQLWWPDDYDCPLRRKSQSCVATTRLAATASWPFRRVLPRMPDYPVVHPGDRGDD
ncbi:MAG: hypothetical protein NXI28_04300 [bacterium]|nr:hypothetical protein [bacterium]